MKARILLLLMFLASMAGKAQAQAWSGIINSTRATDWSTAGLLGIGGIPNRTTVCITSACNTATSVGTAATAAQINAALSSCPSGQVVLLASGTYNINSTLTVPSNCTLRGAGPNHTILNSTLTSGPVVTLGTGGAAFAMGGAKNVLSGATINSTIISVAHADITSFSVGQYMGMDELNSGNVTANGDSGVCSSCSDIGQGGTRAKGIMLEITAVDSTANTITFNPALPIDFTNTPHALAFNVTKLAGVENLQVFANNTGATANFTTNGCAYCWIKGVEGNYADGVHAYMNWSFHSQITDSYFSNSFSHTPGVDAVVQIGYRSTGNLVQNNILERLHSSLIIEQGAVGNVVAYNYGQGDFDTAAPNAIFSGVDFHGANPMFNLIEGNIVTSYGADNVWGSHGPNTAFRNWSRGTSLVCNPIATGRQTVNCVPTGTFAQQSGTNSWYQFQASIAVNLPYETWNFNEVGNVTGSAEQVALRNTSNFAVTNTNSVWAICAGGGTPCGAGSRPYGTHSYTYAYGYGTTASDGSGNGCGGGTAPCYAQLPYTTLFLHGDYDYSTNATTWSGAITHTLPPSFYLSGKPSWWGNGSFPPIGPDVTGGGFARGFVNNNPAKNCYENVMHGDGGTGSPYTFDPVACYAQVQIVDIYISQAGAGIVTGTNCANAKAVSFFNNSSNWGTGPSQIGPGITVHICGTITTGLTAQASGLNGNIINIKFETGATLTSPVWSASTGALNLNGKSFITVDGGTNGSIQNTANGATLANHLATALIITGSGANNVTIKNLLLINAYIHILNSNDPGPGSYYGILARHNSNLTIGPGNTFTNADVGVLFEWDGGESNFVVQGNSFSGINQDIEMGPTTVGATMTNTSIFNNTASSWALWDEPSNNYHHNFFHPFTNVSGASLVGILYVYNNFLQGDMGNHATSMIFLENNNGGTGGTMAPWYVFNNVFDKTNATAPTSTGIMSTMATNGFFLNNTVRDAGGTGANAYNSFNTYVAGWTLKNNIFQGGAYMVYDQASSITANNNVYFNSPSGTPWIRGSTFISSIAAWRSACGCDAVSIITDPKLSANLSLQVGSSAVGEGQNLTSLGITPLNSDAANIARPASSAWDAGAFQLLPPVVLSATYGASVHTTSLNNINVGGPSNWKVAYRFKAAYTSTITGGIYYHISSTTKPGYSGGTLGNIVVSLAADNAGSPGTTLSTCTGGNVGFFPAFSCPAAAVTEGQTYDVVFTNTDGSPTVNFASIDGLYNPSGVLDPNFPYVSLISNGGGWTVYPTVQPILQLNYANGHAQGNGYMEVWINTSSITLSSTNWAREIFTPTQSRLITGVQIGPAVVAGTTVTLALANGTVIQTGTLPAASSTGWSTFNFNPNITLISGTAYQLILSGTGSVYPIRKGTNQAFTNETYFPDGHAQLSTNAGGAWSDFHDESGNASVLGDLEFSFLVDPPLWDGVIDPVRGIDWSTAGVRGGIPSNTWTQSGSTLAAGSSTATIQTALNACGSNHYVLLAAGSFSITNLNVPSHCVLRGSGTLSTIMTLTGTGAAFNLGGGGPAYTNPASATITSGNTAGSTSIVVSSASGISVGTLLAISELNDPTYVSITTPNDVPCTWCSGTGDSGVRARGQVVQVTGVSGTTITITPALYTNYGIASGTGPALAYYFPPGATNAGVENLQVYSNGTGYTQVYLMTACADCWVKGVFDNYADADHADLYWGFHDEIRDSYFSNAYVHLPGSSDTEVDLADKTSATLVENNIFERMHVAVMAEWGAAGNVVGYNYEIGNFDASSTTVNLAFIDFHGAHPQFNLFEGNIGNTVTMDSFWGGGSNNTMFRNNFRATDTLASPRANGRNVVNWGSTILANQQIMGEQIAFLYTNTNSVGNVHGSADALTISTVGLYNSGTSPFTSTILPPANRQYQNFFSAISVGYNTGSDTNGSSVTSFQGGVWVGRAVNSFFQHGNFDVASNAVLWNTVTTRILPASFYHEFKPSWFGSAPWPLIGPDVTGGNIDNTVLAGHVNANPAETCYNNTARDANGLKLFNPNACYGLPGPKPWSGIIDPTRATDWSQGVGISGGIPIRTTICTTLSAGATGAQISAAIAACPFGQVVSLSAGTYNIAGGWTYGGHNGVTVRGAGSTPNQTIINFTSGQACGTQTSDVCMANATGLSEVSPSTQPGGANSANWTAGYAQGSTQITLDVVPAGLAVGNTIILDQQNDAADTGGVFENDNLTFSLLGGSIGRTIIGVEADQQQFVTVTGIVGNVLTITPGLYMNNWRLSQHPSVWWTGAQLLGAGLENVTLNHTGSGTTVKAGIMMFNCHNCFIKNVVDLKANRNHVWLYLSSNSVVRDSYFYGTQGTAVNSYGVELSEGSGNLVENNIFQTIATSVMPGTTQGNVVGYNFDINDSYATPAAWLETSYISHAAGTGMNLFEGNVTQGLFCDDVHGTSNLNTLFRNRLLGWQQGKTQQTNSILLASYCRANNIIGNVLGTSGFHNTYEASTAIGTAGCWTSIYNLGFGVQNCANGVPANDNITTTSLFRWGNYDTVTGAVRWISSEVPVVGIPFVNGNAVPITHNLPNSFYSLAKPLFWSSQPWPPIGPDVIGGAGPGGFAYTTPAQDCWSVRNALSGQPTNGTGLPLTNFDANACYVSVPSTLAITTTSIPNATQNASYSTTLVAANGLVPYTWSVSVGTLPVGLTLNSTTGVLSGTPTVAGSTTFTVRVIDAGAIVDTQVLSLNVVAVAVVTISTTTLPNGIQNAAYTTTLLATGGVTPYVWSVSFGTLPVGLSLSPSMGIISGTPTVGGTSNFTIKVTDANGSTASFAYTITIVPLSITTTTLPNSVQNSVYSTTIVATGGTAPYTWSVLVGSVPVGLILNSGTGQISGTPTAVGTATFTIRVTDANATIATRVLSITVTSISGSGIALVQANSVQGSAVTSIAAPFTITNTVGNLLIVFVRMSTTTQTVGITDTRGNVYTPAVSQVQTIDAHQVAIFYAPNCAGGVNTVTATFSGVNNHPWLAVYEYSGLSPTSPLDRVTGAQGSSTTPNSGATATTLHAPELIFGGVGLPSSYVGSQTAGTNFSLVQSNTSTSPAYNEILIASSIGTYSATFTLGTTANWSAVIATFSTTGIVVLNPSLPNAPINTPYSQTLTAVGGVAPYTWAVTVGTLPTGLSLNSSTGVISGIATSLGNSSFTVRATDSVASTGTKALSILVNTLPIEPKNLGFLP